MVNFIFHRIGITPTHDFFDIASNPVIAQRGYKTVVKVKPTTMTSDENIIGLDINKRKCVADSELRNRLNLFETYSAAACNFECLFNFR